MVRFFENGIIRRVGLKITELSSSVICEQNKLTAPFAPPPTRLQLAIGIGLLLFGLAMPFGRRDDAIGWIAFSYICGFATFLWALLTRRMSIRLIEWYRNRHA
jgi:hypothetical protein